MGKRKEAAPLAPNVVRLPTAATRRVQNFRTPEQRKAAFAARDADPWPGEFINPLMRESMREDEKLQNALSHVQRCPEMFALLCIISAFPADRLDALEAATQLLIGQNPGDENAEAGKALVDHALRVRRAAVTLVGMDARNSTRGVEQ